MGGVDSSRQHISREVGFMDHVDKWRKQTDEPHVGLKHFVSVTWKYFARSLKGRAFLLNNDLEVLIYDGIVEYIDVYGRAEINETEMDAFFSINACPVIFKCVRRVIERYYKKRHRRREDEIVSIDRVDQSILASELRPREHATALIEDLPKDDAELLRTMLLALQYSPNEDPASFVMQVLDIGKQTYRARLSKAAERSAEILRANGWKLDSTSRPKK
jgi:hypothetical protein